MSEESRLERIELLLTELLLETRAKRDKPKPKRHLKPFKGEVSEADLLAADEYLAKAGVYRRAG